MHILYHNHYWCLICLQWYMLMQKMAESGQQILFGLLSTITKFVIIYHGWNLEIVWKMGLLVFQTCLLHTPPFTHVSPVSRVCDGTFQSSHCGSVLAIFKHSSHSLPLSFPQNHRSMVLFPLSMSLGRKFSKLLDHLKVSPRSRSLFLEGVSSLHADSAPSDVPLHTDQFQLASPPCFQNLLLKLNTIASFYSIVCSKVSWAALVFFSVFLATFVLKKAYPHYLNPRKFHQAQSQAEKQQSSQLVPTSHSALFVHGDANKPCPSYSVLFVGNERTPQTASFSPKVHGTYQPAKREEVDSESTDRRPF